MTEFDAEGATGTNERLSSLAMVDDTGEGGDAPSFGPNGADDGDGLTALLDPLYRPPDAFSPKQVEASFAAMKEMDPEGAADLERAWATDAGDNLAYAVKAAKVVMTKELARELTETGIGDHPALVRAAAQLGRLLEHGEAAQPLADVRGRLQSLTKESKTMHETDDEAFQAELEKQTEAIRNAQLDGDHMKATRLDKQRRRFIEQHRPAQTNMRGQPIPEWQRRRAL